jgi:hypothetical protein
MQRNYDTTNGLPFPRGTAIEIAYSASGGIRVEYVEVMAIKDSSNAVQHLDTPPQRHLMDLDAINEPVQLMHPDTGAPIPGQFITKQQLKLHMLAFIRADQVRRDTALGEQ